MNNKANVMTLKYLPIALAVGALACGQGPSWEPPFDDADNFHDAGGNAPVAIEESNIGVEIVTPVGRAECAHVGEIVHLEATVDSIEPVTVKWSFEREQGNCPPVTLAVIDSTTTHTDAYAMFMWSTSCALDVPDGCGVGAGAIAVEVTDVHGRAGVNRVPFCLDPPDVGGPGVAARD